MYSHSLRRVQPSPSQGGSASASQAVSGQTGLGQASLGQARAVQSRSQPNSIARNPVERRIEKRKQHDLPRNVMEQLVTEEVDRQLAAIAASQRRYLKPTQITAYALNRLPSLYVTSDRGWQRQMRRLESDGLGEKIQVAVRQGIIAVQRDPLREVNILAEPELEEATIALQDLRQLLGQPDLGWQNLASTLRMALNHAQNNTQNIQHNTQHNTQPVALTPAGKPDPALDLATGWHSQGHYL
jgi:hypothetical protein